MGMNFCAYVGPYVEVDTTPDGPSFYDTIDDRTLSPVGEMSVDRNAYLVPNVSGPRRFEFDNHSRAVDLTDLDRAAEIAWLESVARDDLAKLRAVFGGARVRWGTLGYWL